MNQMDVDGMNVTARSYAIQIANFSYCVGAALAQANAIMTGWRIGAKEFEECNIHSIHIHLIHKTHNKGHCDVVKCCFKRRRKTNLNNLCKYLS